MKGNNNKTILTFAVVCLFMAAVSSTVLAESMNSPTIISHSGVKSTLFDREYRTFDRYDLIIGEMLYQEESDDFFTKGFRPQKNLNIEGEVRREVYDYPETLSAVALYRQLKRSLNRQTYKELYHCEREACGDVAGWTLYWGREIAGHVSTQYYLAYAKSVAGQSEYISAYINELDGQPRLIIERVARSGRGMGLQINLTGFNITYPKINGEKMAQPKVFYASNAIVPLGDVGGLLNELADQINTRPGQRFAVVGHADEQASPQYNFQLSLKRANYLRQLLISQNSVDAKRIMAYGMGESQPVASNQTAEGRSQNRRVEFFQLHDG